MTLPVPVGVIGAGRRASALAQYEAPLRAARIVRWAPSPCGRDRSRAAAYAEQSGATFAPDWKALAADRSIPAVLVASDDPSRMMALEAALSTGKVVGSFVPVATDATELDRLSSALSRGGVLVPAGTLRHTPAGKRALRIAAQGDLGTLHSVYAAFRFPRPQQAEHGPPILEHAGWEAFDFLLSLTPAEVRRVHAHSTALFGSGSDDTAVLTVRFEDGVIASIELSRCLPPAIPAAPDGDIEVEVIGSRQAIRVLPGAAAVRLFNDGAALHPWVEDAVISLVEEIAAIASGGAARTEGLAQLRRAVRIMDAVRTPGAVTPGGGA